MLDAAYWFEHAVEKLLRLHNFLFLKKPGQLPEPNSVKRILICAYHGIGNFILYTPTIEALRRHFHNAVFDLQVGNRTGCEEVLSGSGYFEQVYDIPTDAPWRDWIEHISHIRSVGYDIVINEFHSNSYALATMVTCSGIPYRVGHVRSPGWPDRYGFVYNIPVTMQEAQHEIDRYYALALALGVEPPVPPVEPFIYLRPEDRAFAADFLNRHAARGAKIIGIQMGTSENMRWKQWQGYRELAELLLEDPQVWLLMLGSKTEAAMIRAAVEGLGQRVIVAAGLTTLKQAAALIERCLLLCCNDSGLMHVAVAVKTPVVAVYGPTDYRRTAPLADIHTIVRKGLACSPCFKLEGDAAVKACSHRNCLNTLQVEEVYSAVRRVLSSRISS
ncbi:MAG: lipopolysaccharide heptosyltransferase II [Acidobacteriota bacterium]|nr:lipopolysaccharide heptosyltransferase II [Blastocatellia bacterium]MDW8412556.1 lipopolysaccharide heptosyltransferase II [Acidobacteriota bacterium]